MPSRISAYTPFSTVPKGIMLSSMGRSISSRTASLNLRKRLSITFTSNGRREAMTCRMLILLRSSPSSLILRSRSRSISYVPAVSPSRPQTMLIPGSTLGSPVSPLSPPMRFTVRTASSTCSAPLLRLFAAATAGSADSRPMARTFPEEQHSARIRMTSEASSGYEEITAGLALSTLRESKCRSLSPSKSSRTLAGSGLGHPEAKSSEP